MPPEPSLLARFGLDGEPEVLAGGEGLAFRVGSVVVKRVHDAAEAAWVQGLLARLEPDGFRVAAPIATHDGGWIADGWSACEWLPGLEPLAPAWPGVIDAGLRFCDAAEQARAGGGAEVLGSRRHRWAVADRVVWDGEHVRLPEPATAIRQRIETLLAPEPDPARVFVHGDLTGNVFVDVDEVPVVLDVAPYLRPRGWAAAIVVGDAVLWNDAHPALAVELAADDQARDLLGRALLFRLVAEQLATSPRYGATLPPYQRVLDALGVPATP
jgi:uncharacterized protein (TIGR02569 family)